MKTIWIGKVEKTDTILKVHLTETSQPRNNADYRVVDIPLTINGMTKYNKLVQHGLYYMSAKVAGLLGPIQTEEV